MNPTGRKSVSGDVLCLNGMIIGWMCRFQQVSVALSTKDAESLAASMVTPDLLGLKELLGVARRNWSACGQTNGDARR